MAGMAGQWNHYPACRPSLQRSSRATSTGGYKAFAFEDRDEPISDELLDSAVCLDDLLYIPTYEEVYAAFHGEEEGEQEPATEEFVCPGSRPENYGEMDACDDCPDAEDCAAELGEAQAEAEADGEERLDASLRAQVLGRSVRVSLKSGPRGALGVCDMVKG